MKHNKKSIKWNFSVLLKSEIDITLTRVSKPRRETLLFKFSNKFFVFYLVVFLPLIQSILRCYKAVRKSNLLIILIYCNYDNAYCNNSEQ